ncbi:hypothetical protein LCGC14_2931180, partial [marine sediment metagenome]
MERVKLKQKRAKRIPRKKKVTHHAFLELDEVEFRVP